MFVLLLITLCTRHDHVIFVVAGNLYTNERLVLPLVECSVRVKVTAFLFARSTGEHVDLIARVRGLVVNLVWLVVLDSKRPVFEEFDKGLRCGCEFLAGIGQGEMGHGSR